MLTIDPALFHASSVSEETRELNQELLAVLSKAPDMWSFPAAKIRADRFKGGGPFPTEPEEKTAIEFDIDSPAGPLTLRQFQPKQGQSKGSYLHIHGGGWVLGSSRLQDARLQEIADNCQLACVSVEYRLAPESPYPAGPDDCQTAAEWLLNGTHDLPTDFLAIGGESAGSHLAALTLLRLRDKLGTCPFHAALLTAGVYDLGQTASARNWGSEKLILTSRDMQMFAARYVQGNHDLRDPDISPLYAPLHGLPPALFSVGTQDLLLDDSLLMASRWHAQNGNAQLDVTPGGCHVFQTFRHLAISQASNAKMDVFLNDVRTMTA